MELFKQTSLDCSKIITNNYSTSFSLGIRTLHKRFHAPIYAIYGFVRYADEIVDTFHDFDKADLLARFKADTYKAIEERISLNPVLHSFQWVVNEYNIEHELIEAFLKSMEMDLHKVQYVEENYNQYIYGSAEVVGLMCLRVFTEGNAPQFDQLREAACRLGAAFQKVNFLRDIKDDYDERGRVYFPNTSFDRFTADLKKNIEADIKADFDAAYKGIIRLPEGARMGVYLAYVYYLALFEKIKQLPPQRVLQERVRVPDNQKFILLLQTYFRHSFNVL